MIDILPFLGAAGLFGLIVELVTKNPAGLLERAQLAGRYVTEDLGALRRTSLSAVATGAAANQGRTIAAA
jgi:hypothetical protein